jgi:uncharacterized protein (TIGR02145 family)
MKYNFALVILVYCLLTSCEKEKPKPSDVSTQITIATGTPVDIKYRSAKVCGTLGETFNLTVQDYGHCWDTVQNPDITKNKTYFGSQKGAKSFTSQLQNLIIGKRYFVKAYYTINDATVYSQEDSLITLFVKDGDGNVYTTITIGTQTWLKENLKTTTYNDGTPIPLVSKSTTWSNLSTPAFCWYNNDEASFKSGYGALYNWYAISITTNGGKNICPSGFHVPSDVEWTVLTDYLTSNGFGYGGNGADIAKALSATWGWNASSTLGTPGNDPGSNNSSGFTAVPGGYRNINGTFSNFGFYGHWWSSTETSDGYACYRILGFSGYNIGSNYKYMNYGSSILCLED